MAEKWLKDNENSGVTIEKGDDGGGGRAAKEGSYAGGVLYVAVKIKAKEQALDANADADAAEEKHDNANKNLIKDLLPTARSSGINESRKEGLVWRLPREWFRIKSRMIPRKSVCGVPRIRT